MEDAVLCRLGRVYVPGDDELKRSVLERYHNPMLVGHLGQGKTLELVTGGYYWPGLQVFLNWYINACNKCQHIKKHHSTKHGDLKPLPLPKGPWRSISYDFITDLLLLKGFNLILW